MSSSDINYTKEAFFNNGNLAFLVVGVVLSVAIAMANLAPIWLPLMFFVALELLYLGVMPRNARYRRHIRSVKMAERHKPLSQKEIFNELSQQSQKRYTKLRKLKQKIRSNYRDLSYASQGLLESHIRKIDGLLTSHLDLLHKRERYRSYMDRDVEQDVRQSLTVLHRDMEDDSERVRAVKERRARILEQRLSRFQRARENYEIIDAQLRTIEDLIEYIHDQSWTLQNPEEISFQLDTLLEEVEETRVSIEEIEDVFASPGDYLSGLDIDEYEASTSGTADDQLDLPTEADRASTEESDESGTQSRRVRN